MKIYITENSDDSIQGYKTIPIIYGKIDLSDVPNNGAEKIIAKNALDQVTFGLLSDFLQSLVSRMRFGCELVLSGTDIGSLSKSIIDGRLTTKEYNSIIFTKKAIYSVNEILEQLKSHNLIINSVSMNGNNYELNVSRQIASN